MTEAPQGKREKTPASHWYSWYQSFDQTYSPAMRQQWYNRAAQAYHWARPRYPDALVNRVVNQAGLKPEDNVLEVGCGPGIATVSFAEKGLVMECVEPSPAACELARQSCRQYGDRVRVTASTFEDWPLQKDCFDAVLAATSFHWIAPTVACQKTAAALKPGGALILLWATPPQPSFEVYQHLQSVYQSYNFPVLGEEQCRTETYYQSNFERFAEVVNRSGFFQPSQVKIAPFYSTYSLKKYLALLTTLSSYIALEEQTRTELLSALGKRLVAKLGTAEMQLTHWFGAQIAVKT